MCRIWRPPRNSIFVRSKLLLQVISLRLIFTLRIDVYALRDLMGHCYVHFAFLFTLIEQTVKHSIHYNNFKPTCSGPEISNTDVDPSSMTILLSIFPPQHRHALYDLALMTNLQDTNQPHQHQRPPNSSTIYKTTKPVYTFPNLYSYAYKYCYNYNIISTQAVLATSIGQLKTARCVL